MLNLMEVHIKLKIDTNEIRYIYKFIHFLSVGTRFSAKPSPDFLNLLESLMQKDPDKRYIHCMLVK